MVGKKHQVRSPTSYAELEKLKLTDSARTRKKDPGFASRSAQQIMSRHHVAGQPISPSLGIGKQPRTTLERGYLTGEQPTQRHVYCCHLQRACQRKSQKEFKVTFSLAGKQQRADSAYFTIRSSPVPMHPPLYSPLCTPLASLSSLHRTHHLPSASHVWHHSFTSS